jgi:hypothetical protein
MKLLSIILLATMLNVSCSNSKKAPSAPAETIVVSTIPAIVGAEDYISLGRTGCYGTCPIYQFKIFGNGNVVYFGRQFVEKLGTYTGKLNDADTKQFFEAVNSVNILSYPNQYQMDNVDFPQFVLEYQYGENVKTIRGNTNADESLIKLTHFIDSMLEKVAFENED